MIRQKNLSILSNRLTRSGGRRLPEALLERDYCLSWFLIGFSRSFLKDRLVFKGGTALKKMYFEDYRFSEDLDFTLVKDTSWEEILRGLGEISKDVQKASGIQIRFDRKDKDSHQNSHTFYLAYEGPLPRQYAAGVKVDITLKEKIVTPPIMRPLLRGYEEYEDIPENIPVLVYSLDEIASEKVVALNDLARNEPRDLYDLWFLLSGNHVHGPELISIIQEKLKFRGRQLHKEKQILKTKEARLDRLWTARLESQMADLPNFQTVFRFVRKSLRDANVSARQGSRRILP